MLTFARLSPAVSQKNTKHLLTHIQTGFQSKHNRRRNVSSRTQITQNVISSESFSEHRVFLQVFSFSPRCRPRSETTSFLFFFFFFQELSAALAVTLRTDGWTSRGTESYFTLTAQCISPEWVIKRPVLQTCLVCEPHKKHKSGRGTTRRTVRLEVWEITQLKLYY